MKNLTERKGFDNRNIKPLPTESCVMNIVYNDIDGESILLCDWKPNDNSRKVDEGYIGTAVTINRKINIGFHTWKQNDSEFIYYKVIP